MNKYESQHMRRREKNLKGDYQCLTDHDVFVLISDAANSSLFVENIVLASLLTGRYLESLVENRHLIKLSQEHGLAILPSTVEYPQNNLSSEMQKYVTKSTHSPYALIPLNISNSMLTDTLSEYEISNINQNAKIYLRKLNAQFTSRLTLARISKYIDSNAFQFGISDAELVWIKGQELKEHGGAWYLQMRSSEYAVKQVNFIKACYEKANLKVDSINLHDMNSQFLIGSSLQIKRNVLKVHVALIQNRIRQIKSAATLDIMALHNYVTYYTLLILNISTGHRPRKEAYRTIDFFDLTAGTVLIFDKENRGPGTSRIIPLTDTAKQQIKNYLSHLELMQTWFRFDKPTISTQIEQVINSQRSLFNFIVTSGSSSTFRLITPANLKKVIPEKLPLKSNWHRHSLRAHLSKERELSQSIINYFMGHEDKIDETSSRYSVLTFSDITSAKKSIQSFTDSINALVLKGFER